MGSPSAAKQVVEKQQPYGLNPLVDTPAVPMTTEINTSSLRRHPSTGSIMFDKFLPGNVLLACCWLYSGCGVSIPLWHGWLSVLVYGILYPTFWGHVSSSFVAWKSIGSSNIGAGQLLGALG
ncbi:hypothetical protein NC651_002034 [Populus alba x Populus x berolinensis]|nr:hypothetical protein NC651_002034 [Populus alba x Populus x berolinensis]